MKKVVFILSLFMFSEISEVDAQGLHPGECAIMYTYDAAGNLIQRQFFCNNSGGVVYSAATREEMENDSIKPGNTMQSPADEIIKVKALLPNPTTGKFMVRLSHPLNNANVLLLDANGKVIYKRKQTGNDLSFDISSQPSGIYFVRVESNGKAFSFKVIKE